MDKQASSYEYNVVFRSSLTGEWYFAPRVRVLSETTRAVVGRKFNVTAHIEPFLLKKWRRARRVVELAQSVSAVDPHGPNTGTPSTREKESS